MHLPDNKKDTESQQRNHTEKDEGNVRTDSKRCNHRKDHHSGCAHGKFYQHLIGVKHICYIGGKPRYNGRR